MAFLFGARSGGRLLSRSGVLAGIGRGVSALWRGGGAATRTAVGVGAGVAATDALIIPAVNSVTGREVTIGPLDGTLTRDALAGAAQSVGQVLGTGYGASVRGVSEGALGGLLPEVRGETGTIVTVAILGIGAVLIWKTLQ